MRVGHKADFDGYVTSGNDCGYLVVIADRSDEYGPVFINWVPIMDNVVGAELRRVQYGNPKELSLVAFAFAPHAIHENLLAMLARFRISNRNWFVRSTPVEQLINHLTEE